MFYCGLDVSLRETAICIVDADGKIVKELKVSSDPDAIASAIRGSGFVCEKVGLESGSTAAWLQAGLVTLKFPAICNRCSSRGGDVAGGLAQQI
jgi:transposase